LSATPATLVIDISLCYRTAGGTDARLESLKYFNVIKYVPNIFAVQYVIDSA
jgi:hypothetical protein